MPGSLASLQDRLGAGVLAVPGRTGQPDRGAPAEGGRREADVWLHGHHETESGGVTGCRRGWTGSVD